MTARPDNKERGAVLITTLLLMSVMAVITVTIMDDIRFSIKRAASTQIAEQLSWYSRGGEDYAENWLSTQLDSKQTTLRKIILSEESAIFPIEQGELHISIRDGQNCFNLNALADVKKADQTRQQLKRLLSYLDISEADAQTVSASVQDWIDRDSVPLQGGAEDFIYANLKPGYRAANTMMADISELREIQGVDEEMYQTISPYLCVLPDKKQPVLNVNTMSEEDAVIAGALYGNRDGFTAAQEVIADRPLAGYENPQAIDELEVVKDLENNNGTFSKLFDVKTQKVDLQIDIVLGDQVRGYIASFALGDGKQVQLVSRRSRN